MSQFSSTSTFAMSDFSQTGTFGSSSRNGSSSSSSFQPKGFKKFFKKSPILPLIIVLVVIFGVAIFALTNVINRSTTSATPSLASGKMVQAVKPVATESLNKSFDFPLKDASGKTVSQLHYVIQSAEIDNQIIIRGQRASAVDGRTFLVLNLQITNSYDKSIQLNTRDYVRLVTGSSTEKLAADIHNDPVEVQAISTKYTRLGFAINSADIKDLTLQVGEITGPKQSVKLNLQ